MKKIILGIAVSVAFAITAAAQPHHSASFLTVPAVYVTNTFGITNLAFPGVPNSTNKIGTTFTNMNSRVVSSATVADTFNLLSTVPLWSDRNGTPVGIWPSQTDINTVTNGLNTAYIPVFATVSGEIIADSGANSAVTFTFVPVPASAGGMPDNTTAVSAVASEWSFSITATASDTVRFKTNAPAWLWSGCAGLMCKRIVNADTDATSKVIVRNLKFNGFVP